MWLFLVHATSRYSGLAQQILCCPRCARHGSRQEDVGPLLCKRKGENPLLISLGNMYAPCCEKLWWLQDFVDRRVLEVAIFWKEE